MSRHSPSPAICAILERKKAVRLTRDQAAEFLGVAVTSVANDVVTGRRGVPFYKIGNKVFYDLGELEEYESRCRSAGRAA